MFIKKNESNDLHFEQANEITRKFYCKNCVEKEGGCSERFNSDLPRCYTFRCVMNRFRKILDRFDK